jgi:DNA-binding response OmpR family regulator
MAKVLLVDFEKQLGELVSELLQQARHDVEVHARSVPLTEVEFNRLPRFALVILDVSLDNRVSREHLRCIQDYRDQHGGRPLILAVSRVYRGSRFEFDLERKSVRVVYV